MNRNRQDYASHAYGGSHHQQQQQAFNHSNYAYHHPPQTFQHQHDVHHLTHENHSLSYTPTSEPSDVSSRSFHKKYRRQPRGWGYRCLRGFFSSCNFMFWLLGCAILGAGIWLHFSKSEYHAVLPISSSDYLCSATLAIAIGATVLVIGFLGCCGSLMQIRCMLLAYFIIVMMLVLFECGIGLMGFAYKDHIDSSVKKELRKTIEMTKNRRGEEMDREGKRIKDAWDSLQSDWSCCGVDSYQDWTGVTGQSFGDKVIMAYSTIVAAKDHKGGRKHHKSHGGKHRKGEEVLIIPDSCCRKDEVVEIPGDAQAKRKKKKEHSTKVLTCGTGIPVAHLKKLIADATFAAPPPIHARGCYAGLKFWFSQHQATFSYSILALAIIQFLALLAAMMLFCVLGEYGRFW